jgi:hypothetical protein
MRHLKRPWMTASVGSLVVMCITFGILVGTGQIRLSGEAQDEAALTPSASDESRWDSIDTARVREGLEAMGLSGVPENVVATLSTLKKIDSYPVYTMRYFGPYVRASELQAEAGQQGLSVQGEREWACSLFAAVGDPDGPIFGRNFDWEHSPILVLLLEPKEGYRSIMSIDIAYLVEPADVGRLDECEVEKLLPLLSAPFLTFDGMNERGLAIGMAAVDYECGYPSDPDKRDVGDLRLMREVIESSATVDEAIAFLEGINPVSQGGPNTHYLIADATPSAALIEYHDGEMVVFRSSAEAPWQLGTNFPVVLTEGDPAGHCWRYDRIEATLREHGGALSTDEAAELLQAVSTPMTRWSIVYDLANLEMHLVIEREPETVHTFSLEGEVE